MDTNPSLHLRIASIPFRNNKGVGKPEDEDRKPLKFLFSDLN